MDSIERAKQVWLAGLADEIQYWTDAIRSAPADAWDARPLREDVAALLAGVTAPVPSILDIGAGPMTSIGSIWTGRQVRIVAVDPLADVYNQIMAESGIRPSIPTSWCHGEFLHERFPADSFDLVYSCNAMDHSYAPDHIVRSGLHVLKPGATMLLRHWINEAETGKYGGLHQWNFDCQDEHFVIWNRATRIDMSSILSPWAEVACHVVERKRWKSGKVMPFLEVRLRKRSAGPTLEDAPLKLQDANRRIAGLTDELRAESAERARLQNLLSRANNEAERYRVELREVLASRTWRWAGIARRAWRFATKARS